MGGVEVRRCLLRAEIGHSKGRRTGLKANKMETGFKTENFIGGIQGKNKTPEEKSNRTMGSSFKTEVGQTSTGAHHQGKEEHQRKGQIKLFNELMQR